MNTIKDIDANSLKISTPKPSPIDARFRLSFALLCIINLVCAIDATILAVVLPTIATLLHGTAIQAFWTSTSFLLTSTIFIPTFISLSHLIDRKSILVATLLLFTIGSIICSLANNFTVLLIGRSIQGIGGGGITALTNVIVSDLVSLKDRGKWWGYIAMMWCLGAAIGPLAGGGVMYPWSDYRTLLPFMIGIMGLLTFLEYSYIYARHPLMRGSIFKTSTGTINFICTSIHGIVLWSLLYYMPLYYAIAQNLSPIMCGVVLLPFTLMMGPASTVVSIAIAVTGRYRPSLWLGWTLTTIGTLLMLSFTPTTPFATLIAIQLLGGLGFGILYPAMSFAVQAPASDFDIPFAAAMFTFFRTLGQAIGVAISGNIFQQTLRKKIRSNPILGPLGKADEWSRDASALVGYIKSLSDGGVKRGLVKAYCDALHMVIIVMCVLAGLAMVVSLVGTKELSLERRLNTEQGWKGKESENGDEEHGKKDRVELEVSVSDERSSKSLRCHWGK
ncbi:related to putative multidrug transporter [Phialocephala subalpina]|uniref:Related to putative multidrug transporter n=1 Tax=Phialocephala subalpina TaxID=576137 RepID=A0A1L7XIF6_9HELO|nr:related to putative multidrug transporter [Phialocephala subalpina]